MTSKDSVKSSSKAKSNKKVSSSSSSKKGKKKSKSKSHIMTKEEQIAELEAQLKLLKKKPRTGCCRFDPVLNRWSFTWREDGKQRCKYFPLKKYGHSSPCAQKVCEAYRRTIFPDYESD